MSVSKNETASKINQKLNGALASFQFPAAPKKAAKAPVAKKAAPNNAPMLDAIDAHDAALATKPMTVTPVLNPVPVSNAVTQDCITCSRPGTVGEQCAKCLADEAAADAKAAASEPSAKDVRAAAKALRASNREAARLVKLEAKEKRAEAMTFKRAERAAAKAGRAEQRKERIAAAKAAKADKAAEKKAKRSEAKRERMLNKAAKMKAKAEAFDLRMRINIALEAFMEVPSARNFTDVETALIAFQDACNE